MKIKIVFLLVCCSICADFDSSFYNCIQLNEKFKNLERDYDAMQILNERLRKENDRFQKENDEYKSFRGKSAFAFDIIMKSLIIIAFSLIIWHFFLRS